jgi:hypothetical protein
MLFLFVLGQFKWFHKTGFPVAASLCAARNIDDISGK